MFDIVLLLLLITVLGMVQQFVGQRRLRAKRTISYNAFTARAMAFPPLGEVIDALAQFGYRAELEREAPENPFDSIFVVRERRLGRDDGRVVVRLLARGGVLHGEVVGEDVGPPFYDELGQYLLGVLAQRLPDMRVGGGRPPAVGEGTELPPEPLGMALLPDDSDSRRAHAKAY